MNRIYRTSALEAIARKTLKEYDPMLLYGTPTAIPIESIAERLGLYIEYQCLRKNGIILGETVFNDTYVPVYFAERKCYDLIFVKKGTIILDERLLSDKADGRLRFTCAHELAHWLLHKELFSGTGRIAAFVDTEKSSDENSIIERQADILACSLLMPTGQVKRAFYNFRSSRSREPTLDISELFGVSKQAMSIFLKEHFLN